MGSVSEEIRSVFVNAGPGGGRRTTRMVNVRIVRAHAREAAEIMDTEVETVDVEKCSSSECEDEHSPGPSTTARTYVSCQLCREEVPSTERRRHIYRCHLRLPLFTCPLCSFHSTYHWGNTHQHITTAHCANLAPISHKKRYKNAIDGLLYTCFGDISQLTKCADPSVAKCVVELVDTVVERERKREQVMQVHSRVGREKKKDDEKEKSTSTCRMCGMRGIVHAERHVLQYHLRRPVFHCPYCDYDNNYAPSSVKDHIKKKHADHPQCAPVDSRHRVNKLITDMQWMCFGRRGREWK